MKILVKWLIRPLLWFFGCIIALLLLSALFQYLCAPVYTFTEPHPFSGNLLYNPYDSCKSGEWIRGNFQVHSHSWGGITNGKGSSQDIFDRYRYLGYDIVAISDYQSINRNIYPGLPDLTPNYEHGYGVKKNHQLNIGANRVLWFDFLFPQTRSNKQFILNLLSRRSDVVVLSHPVWNDAYTPADIRLLGNYRGIEVASNYRNSASLWDSALSAGKPVFVTADDDGHHIGNPNLVAKCLTLLNVEDKSRASVVRALLYGRTIGVELASVEDEPFEAKKRRLDSLAYVKQFELKGDTILITISRPAKQILFIGQNGAVVRKTDNDTISTCIFGKTDTYIRTELRFADGTIFYLNPVFRYNGQALSTGDPELNWLVTISKNALCGVLLLLAVVFFPKIRKKKSIKK